MVLVLPLELPVDYVPSKQDLEELFGDKALREMIPTAHSARRVTLETLPAVVFEYDQTDSRLGVDFIVRSKMFMVLFKNRLVIIKRCLSFHP